MSFGTTPIFDSLDGNRSVPIFGRNLIQNSRLRYVTGQAANDSSISHVATETDEWTAKGFDRFQVQGNKINCNTIPAFSNNVAFDGVPVFRPIALSWGGSSVNNAYLTFGQALDEGVLLGDYVFSFYAKSPVNLSIGVHLDNKLVSNPSVRTFIHPLSTGLMQINSTSFKRYSVRFNVPTPTSCRVNGYDTRIAILLSMGSDFNNQTNGYPVGHTTGQIEIGGFQLERGIIPTPLEETHISVDKAGCDRWFQRKIIGDSCYMATWHQAANQFLGEPIYFDKMVSTPTISIQQLIGSFYWTRVGSDVYSANTTAGSYLYSLSGNSLLSGPNAYSLRQVRTAGTSSPPVGGDIYTLDACVAICLDAS
jgi:hypothetical protein